jgi:hypothetical protein
MSEDANGSSARMTDVFSQRVCGGQCGRRNCDDSGKQEYNRL